MNKTWREPNEEEPIWLQKTLLKSLFVVGSFKGKTKVVDIEKNIREIKGLLILLYLYNYKIN